MATVGLKAFTIGLIDAKGNLITGEKGLSTDGIFEVNAVTGKGATQANITGLAPTMTKIWGSDSLIDQEIGKVSPQVALGANDLPHEIVDKILGRKPEDGGQVAVNGTLPHAALLVTSHSKRDNAEVYFGFYDGFFTMSDKNMQTDTETAQRSIDNLTFHANYRANDGAPYVTFNQADKEFDRAKMLANVFPGYGGIGANQPNGDKTDTAKVDSSHAY
ncbi:major tail protein [Lactiplantibacillus plantarum]|uniref:major tail protein n=1 Tax=Lactiplantibacillus plantarum TaxID=1590 RepID=UPI00309CB382